MTDTPRVAHVPSFLVLGHLRFLIIDAPTDANVEAYMKEFRDYNVTQLVRVCESTYSPDRVIAGGIPVTDMPFADGAPPPADVIDRWLALCRSTFAKGNPTRATIAIHCVAGLGRAPTLVAIAMMEEGLEALDAVTAIRAKRRGAINAKQLHYLEHQYKRRSRCGGAAGCACVIA